MKIKNSCGKKSGCQADIVLPYGVAPKQVKDKSNPQTQAGTKQTSK